MVSIGTKDLPWVREYIRNQREHHARDMVQERLERIEYDETWRWERVKPPRGADGSNREKLSPVKRG